MISEDREATLEDYRQIGREDAAILVTAVLPDIDACKGQMPDGWADRLAEMFADAVFSKVDKLAAVGVTYKERTAYHVALKAEWDVLMKAAFAPYIGGR